MKLANVLMKKLQTEGKLQIGDEVIVDSVDGVVSMVRCNSESGAPEGIEVEVSLDDGRLMSLRGWEGIGPPGEVKGTPVSHFKPRRN